MEQSLIVSIKKSISEDDIDEAFDAMQKNISNQRLSDEVILIKSRHNAINRQQMLGIIDDATARTERNKIRLSLLDILKKVTPENNDAPSVPNQPTTHIGDIIYGNVTKIDRQINMGNSSTYNEGK